MPIDRTETYAVLNTQPNTVLEGEMWEVEDMVMTRFNYAHHDISMPSIYTTSANLYQVENGQFKLVKEMVFAKEGEYKRERYKQIHGED